MVSGFFSAKVFCFTFKDLFLRRLWFFLVPYVVWVPIELWFKFREWNLYDGKEMPGISCYIEHIVEGRNMYWFLYALVIFNIVLWLTRKLPWWAGVLVGFAPILILPLHADQHMIGKAVLYLPAFLLGAHLRQHIRHFAETATSLRHLTRGTILYAAGFSLAAVWAWWNTVSDVSFAWPLRVRRDGRLRRPAAHRQLASCSCSCCRWRSSSRCCWPGSRWWWTCCPSSAGTPWSSTWAIPSL